MQKLMHCSGVSCVAIASLSLSSFAATVNVDTETKYQTISGFGACSAWQNNISDEDADLLWSTTNGAGLSLHRIMINGDGTTSEVRNAQKAVARGVKVWAAPWNNNYSYEYQSGGCTDHHLDWNMAQTWADAIANLVTTMEEANAPLYAISSQNEPDMPCAFGSYYSPSDMVRWVGDYLGPTITPLGVKLISPETVNWYAFPGYKTAILADAKATQYTSILATHLYGGQISPHPEVAAAGKEFWQTETYDMHSNVEDPGMTSALHIEGVIHEGLTIANFNAWHFWWVYPCDAASCGNGGLWNQGNNAGPSKRLWIMGNYSRFVRPGYVRIGATATPEPGVRVTAYYGASDNQVVIVAADTNFTPASVDFSLGTLQARKITPWLTDENNSLVAQADILPSGAGFSYTLPPRSVTTLVVDLGPRADSLDNGSFNDGTSGWMFNVWGGGATGSVVDGVYQIRIDNLGSLNHDIQLVQAGLVLKQGFNYRVSFDASASANRNIDVNMEKDDSPWTSYLNSTRTFALSTSTDHYSFVFTMEHPTDSNARISINAGESTETVILDNVSVVLTEEPVTKIMKGAPIASGLNVKMDGQMLRVDFKAPRGTPATISVYNLNGDRILEQSLATGGGEVHSWTGKIVGLTEQLYIVKVQSGEKLLGQKTIVRGN